MPLPTRSVRLTVGVFLYLSLPEFAPELKKSLMGSVPLADFDFGAVRMRLPCGQFEITTTAGNETRAMLLAHSAAYWLVNRTAQQQGLGDWQQFGKYRVERVENSIPPVPPIMSDADPSMRCPQCGGPMAYRASGRGDVFWGCLEYPACRGTRSIPA